MRLSWAIVLGLAAGIGLGAWLLKKDAAPPPATAASSAPGAPVAAQYAPKLYRWRDADGVLQVTQQPPADRPFEEVKIRDDQNVVPMSGPSPEPTDEAQTTPDD